MFFTEGFLKFLLYYFAAVSVVTLVMYMIDKIKAMSGAWRISEKALLIASIIGGAAGGYLAMFLAWHKVRKWYFHVVNIIGLLWQLGLLGYIAWMVLL
jgi:uncharacterized membrane protein YsdA (DUF1294 family)